MAMKTFLTSFLDRIETTGNVQSVFGEPIQVGDKTIIPVARIGYGFGGGYGEGKGDESDGEGGGGGGCLSARPIGVIEVTPEVTRYVPLTRWRTLVGAGLIGLALGLVAGFRR